MLISKKIKNFITKVHKLFNSELTNTVDNRVATPVHNIQFLLNAFKKHLPNPNSNYSALGSAGARLALSAFVASIPLEWLIQDYRLTRKREERSSYRAIRKLSKLEEKTALTELREILEFYDPEASSLSHWWRRLYHRARWQTVRKKIEGAARDQEEKTESYVRNKLQMGLEELAKRLNELKGYRDQYSFKVENTKGVPILCVIRKPNGEPRLEDKTQALASPSVDNDPSGESSSRSLAGESWWNRALLGKLWWSRLISTFWKTALLIASIYWLGFFFNLDFAASSIVLSIGIPSIGLLAAGGVILVVLVLIFYLGASSPQSIGQEPLDPLESAKREVYYQAYFKRLQQNRVQPLPRFNGFSNWLKAKWTLAVGKTLGSLSQDRVNNGRQPARHLIWLEPVQGLLSGFSGVLGIAVLFIPASGIIASVAAMILFLGVVAGVIIAYSRYMSSSQQAKDLELGIKEESEILKNLNELETQNIQYNGHYRKLLARYEALGNPVVSSWLPKGSVSADEYFWRRLEPRTLTTFIKKDLNRIQVFLFGMGTGSFLVRGIGIAVLSVLTGAALFYWAIGSIVVVGAIIAILQVRVYRLKRARDRATQCLKNCRSIKRLAEYEKDFYKEAINNLVDTLKEALNPDSDQQEKQIAQLRKKWPNEKNLEECIRQECDQASATISDGDFASRKSSSSLLSTSSGVSSDTNSMNSYPAESDDSSCHSQTLAQILDKSPTNSLPSKWIIDGHDKPNVDPTIKRCSNSLASDNNAISEMNSGSMGLGLADNDSGSHSQISDQSPSESSVYPSPLKRSKRFFRSFSFNKRSIFSRRRGACVRATNHPLTQSFPKIKKKTGKAENQGQRAVNKS